MIYKHPRNSFKQAVLVSLILLIVYALLNYFDVFTTLRIIITGE